MISIDHVPELKTAHLTNGGLVVGAGVTMAELEEKLFVTVSEING